jgi:hypothetical protein
MASENCPSTATPYAPTVANRVGQCREIGFKTTSNARIAMTRKA